MIFKIYIGGAYSMELSISIPSISLTAIPIFMFLRSLWLKRPWRPQNITKTDVCVTKANVRPTISITKRAHIRPNISKDSLRPTKKNTCCVHFTVGIITSAHVRPTISKDSLRPQKKNTCCVHFTVGIIARYFIWFVRAVWKRRCTSDGHHNRAN